MALKDATHHLQVRNAHVEVLVHVSVPYDPNVCEVKGAQVSLQGSKARLKPIDTQSKDQSSKPYLIARQVPNSNYLIVQLLFGQMFKLTLVQDGASQLHLTIEL